MAWVATPATNAARSSNIPARCNTIATFTAVPIGAPHAVRPSVGGGTWSVISTRASTGARPTGSALDRPEATIATPASAPAAPWRWPWPRRASPFPVEARAWPCRPPRTAIAMGPPVCRPVQAASPGMDPLWRWPGSMWSCWCRPTAGSGCRMLGIHPHRLTTPRPKPCLHDATWTKMFGSCHR